MTPSLSSGGTVVLSPANKELTARLAERCTNRCTGTDRRADELAAAVALIARLACTDDERARLLTAAVELLGK
jgi:hypothetical protein